MKDIQEEREKTIERIEQLEAATNDKERAVAREHFVEWMRATRIKVLDRKLAAEGARLRSEVAEFKKQKEAAITAKEMLSSRALDAFERSEKAQHAMKRSARVLPNEKIEVARLDALMDEMSNPHNILDRSIRVASVDRGFNKDAFKIAMSDEFFGDSYQAIHDAADTKTKKALDGAKAKFDKELDKLATEVEKGIKNKTLDQPQKNGILKKCFRGMLKCITAIIAIATPVLGASLTTKAGVALAAKIGVDSAALGAVGTAVSGAGIPGIAAGVAGGVTVAGAGAGLVAGGLVAYVFYKANRYLDSTSKSSKPEECMDRLVEVADQGFDKHMKKIAETVTEPAAAKHATRFQDRVKAVKSQGKTFEGREAAKRKAAEDRGQERD